MIDRYTEAARREWTEARRKALWSQLRASLGSKKNNLIDFTELTQRYDLGNARYRGVQAIPLDKIVGSAGRYQDFIRTFLPTNRDMGERWQKIARLRLDPNSRGWPPIEVYKVGDEYFVIDGNHRVSVAHQLKLPEIEARVWEFFRPMLGRPHSGEIEPMLLDQEREDFLQKTRLDDLRPGHGVRLTAPGGYPVMLSQIAATQEILSQIDRVEVSYEEAVAAWYDMTFESTVELIEQSGVLDAFPNRTAADFFVWVLQNQRALEEQYQDTGRTEDAAPEEPRPKGWLRPWQTLLRRLRGTRPPGHN